MKAKMRPFPYSHLNFNRSGFMITLGEVKLKSLKILANFLHLIAFDGDLNLNLARFFRSMQILQDILQDSGKKNNLLLCCKYLQDL